jgi:hypothetical protein
VGGGVLSDCGVEAGAEGMVVLSGCLSSILTGRGRLALGRIGRVLLSHGRNGVGMGKFRRCDARYWTEASESARNF